MNDAGPHLREPDPTDLPWMLELNNRHATELSELDDAELQLLTRTASHVRVVDDAALLIAFDHTAPRDSANFDWFRQRFARFLYVDRVVVAEKARGRGLARALYDDVMAAARGQGLERVVSEVNAEPPNPASDAFHTSRGFQVVGSARLDGGKTVRYWAVEVGSGTGSDVDAGPVEQLGTLDDEVTARTDVAAHQQLEDL